MIGMFTHEKRPTTPDALHGTINSEGVITEITVTLEDFLIGRKGDVSRKEEVTYDGIGRTIGNSCSHDGM